MLTRSSVSAPPRSLLNPIRLHPYQTFRSPFTDRPHPSHRTRTGTMDYEIERTTSDEQGYSVARKGLGQARKRYSNMTSLNLPTGKSAGDMKEGGGGKNVNANNAARSVDEEVGVDSGDKDTNSEITKDALKNTNNDTTTPTTTNHEETKRAHLKWKSPDGRILALRKLARESGKEYEERIRGTRGKKAVVWRP